VTKALIFSEILLVVTSKDVDFGVVFALGVVAVVAVVLLDEVGADTVMFGLKICYKFYLHPDFKTYLVFMFLAKSNELLNHFLVSFDHFRIEHHSVISKN
jgi:hypothetical protein